MDTGVPKPNDREGRGGWRRGGPLRALLLKIAALLGSHHDDGRGTATYREYEVRRRD